MEIFTLILCVIGAVLLSSFLSRFIPKVSTPLVQIALGALASQLPFFPDTQLDPELFMVLFIAPLLYLEAHEINKSELLRSLSLSLSLAVGLAVATMVGVGFTLHAIWPAAPLAAALALGAALGPTDAVAVSSLSHEASLSSRQIGVLKGESLFNDASGIVGFQFAVAAAMTGTFEVGAAVNEFLLSFFGGALLGIVMGVVINWIFETSRSMGWETTTTRILMELFLPFVLYLTAESLQVSGILCVVAAGLLIRFDRTGIGPNVSRSNIVASSVWSVLSFSLNGSVFILLGMLLPDAMRAAWQNPDISNLALGGFILAVALVVVGMRFIWVSAMLRIARDEQSHQRRRMTAERWRSAVVMTFGGAKGTITLSLMFTIPYTIANGHWFPMRDELIFIAGGVIIITLLLANFILPLAAPRNSVQDTRKIMQTTIEVLRRTVEELAARVTDDNRRAIMMIIDSYTKRISRLKHRLGSTDASDMVNLQIAALEWEKDYVKARLNVARETPDNHMEIEVCERLLDQIMHSLRHAITDHDSAHALWQIKGRLRSVQRRTTLLARRVGEKIRRSTPIVSEDQIYVRMQAMQIDAFDYVIEQLYEQMQGTTYKTEDCSALLLDYRRAEATLKSRPNMGISADLIAQTEEYKRESYGIELGVIQDMLEEGLISRSMARQLRKNVYVMGVDADASL